MIKRDKTQKILFLFCGLLVHLVANKNIVKKSNAFIFPLALSSRHHHHLSSSSVIFRLLFPNIGEEFHFL